MKNGKQPELFFLLHAAKAASAVARVKRGGSEPDQFEEMTWKVFDCTSTSKPA